MPRVIINTNNGTQFYPTDNIIREVVELNMNNFRKYGKNFTPTQLSKIIYARGLRIEYQQTQKLEFGHPLVELIEPITSHGKTQYVTSPQPIRLSSYELLPRPNHQHGFTLYDNGSTPQHLNDKIFYSSDYAPEAYFSDNSTAANLAQATKYVVESASNSPYLTLPVREHYVNMAHALDQGKTELAFIVNDYDNRIINFEHLPCVDINHLVSSEKILNCLSHPPVSFGYEELLRTFECAASSGFFYKCY